MNKGKQKAEQDCDCGCHGHPDIRTACLECHLASHPCGSRDPPQHAPPGTKPSNAWIWGPCDRCVSLDLFCDNQVHLFLSDPVAIVPWEGCPVDRWLAPSALKALEKHREACEKMKEVVLSEMTKPKSEKASRGSRPEHDADLAAKIDKKGGYKLSKEKADWWRRKAKEYEERYRQAAVLGVSASAGKKDREEQNQASGSGSSLPSTADGGGGAPTKSSKRKRNKKKSKGNNSATATSTALDTPVTPNQNTPPTSPSIAAGPITPLTPATSVLLTPDFGTNKDVSSPPLPGDAEGVSLLGLGIKGLEMDSRDSEQPQRSNDEDALKAALLQFIGQVNALRMETKVVQDQSREAERKLENERKKAVKANSVPDIEIKSAKSGA